MVRSKWTILLAAVLFLPLHAFAAGQDEQHAYCTYVLEQAQAQRDLLRTPIANAAMTQPETGLPPQFVAGASLSLSDYRKAGLTMDAARKNCELYKSSTEAQQDIQYATASLEREALRNRLTLIEHASNTLDTLTDKTSKMVEAQNATRLMLFSLQTTKIKLEADRADTQSKMSAIYVPKLSGDPLKELVAEKQAGEAGEQRALDKLSRQSEWNVALSVGVHQQFNPVAFGPQPYGEVSVSYNFAGRAIDKHFDRAAEAHDEWKKAQEGDASRGMEVLRQQLVDGIAMQGARLKSLQDESTQIEKNLQLVVGADTTAALDFQNQLNVAQLLLEIEKGDSTFRMEALREYLAKNF